jgi:ribonucleoside-diphosphate reductase alpha chain
VRGAFHADESKMQMRENGAAQMGVPERSMPVQLHGPGEWQPASQPRKGTQMINFAPFAEEISLRYRHVSADGERESWEQVAHRVTKNVMRAVDIDMRSTLAKDIRAAIATRKFMPAGRYLYSAGRPYHQCCNCLALRAHDSREGWAELVGKACKALMTGAGVGAVYSDIRHAGAVIRKTGGTASGPLPLIQMINECGRGVIQGGDRRCAIWAGLRWNHRRN